MSMTTNIKQKLIKDAQTIEGEVSSYMIIKADENGRVQVALNASLQEAAYLITSSQNFIFNFINGNISLQNNENNLKQ